MTSDENASQTEQAPAQRAPRHREPPVIEGEATDTTPAPVAATPDDPAAVDAPLQEPAAEPASEPAKSRGSLRSLAPLIGMAAAILVTWVGLGVLAWQSMKVAARDKAAIAQLSERVDQLPTSLPTPSPTIPPDQFASLAHRVTVLEQRPQPKPADPAPAAENPAIEAVQVRLTALEKRLSEMTVAAQPASPQPVPSSGASDVSSAAPPVADLAPLEQRIEALDQRLGPLDQRSGSADQRIATLEANLDAVEKMIAAPKSEDRVRQDPDSKAPHVADMDGLAVIADVLQTAVRSGRPFPQVYAAAEALGADSTLLGKLKPFASSGVPSREAVAAAFAQASRATLAAATPRDDNGGILGKLTASATGLVRVRPAGEPEGQDPPALVSKISAALERDDPGAALEAWKLLPGAAQTASSAFADLARGRQAAEVAAGDLLDSALAALSAPKGGK